MLVAHIMMTMVLRCTVTLAPRQHRSQAQQRRTVDLKVSSYCPAATEYIEASSTRYKIRTLERGGTSDVSLGTQMSYRTLDSAYYRSYIPVCRSSSFGFIRQSFLINIQHIFSKGSLKLILRKQYPGLAPAARELMSKTLQTFTCISRPLQRSRVPRAHITSRCKHSLSGISGDIRIQPVRFAKPPLR